MPQRIICHSSGNKAESLVLILILVVLVFILVVLVLVLVLLVVLQQFLAECQVVARLVVLRVESERLLIARNGFGVVTMVLHDDAHVVEALATAELVGF